MHRRGVIDTPCGAMRAVVDDAGALVSLMFVHSSRSLASQRILPGNNPKSVADAAAVRHVATELAAYFHSADHRFELAIAPRGTPFMQRVWRLLRTIPTGRVTTYTALALALSPASSPRAVGRANALNPLAIVVPCHRVVGQDGALTGYEGGLERKAWLLRHEGLETTLTRGTPALTDSARLPGYFPSKVTRRIRSP